MPGVLLCCSVHQAHREVLLAGILLCRSVCQALKGAPWVENYSVVLGIRHLMGQPLYCSAANAGVGAEGEAMVMAPLSTRGSEVLPCFHGCPAFLHWRLNTMISSLTSHCSISPQSIAAQALGLFHTPKLQLLATVPSRGPSSLSRVCMAAARTV